MTNKMLEDLVVSLQKKIKKLSILAIILGLVCTALIVFIFGNYEVVYEEVYEEKEHAVEQDSGEGGSNTAIIDSELNENNDLYIICGTIIVCVIVIVGGAVIYGKTKNHN